MYSYQTYNLTVIIKYISVTEAESMQVLKPRLVKKCVGAVKIVDISQYRQRTKYSLSFAISEV